MKTKPAVDSQLRTVNRKVIDTWIYFNGPGALAKLAQLAMVSEATLAKARLGRCPRKTITMVAICEAMGAKIDDVFPPLRRSQAV